MRILKIWWISDNPLMREHIEILRELHQEAKIFPERKIVGDILSFIRNHPRDMVYIDRALLENIPNIFMENINFRIFNCHCECREDGTAILAAIFHISSNGKIFERKIWARPDPDGEGVILPGDY